jgi:quercetin dioxygenase-like cupin family protein
MRRMLQSTLQASAFVLAFAAAAAPQAQSPAPAQPATAGKARVARVAPLPKMDGANLKVHAVEVTYPPGATSTAHRHPCPLVGYMVSGQMRMQVSDGPLTDYKAGDTFVEMPTDVHRVATNPSKDTPAVFLVTFVCDKETPLTVPEPAAAPR